MDTQEKLLARIQELEEALQVAEELIMEIIQHPDIPESIGDMIREYTGD